MYLQALAIVSHRPVPCLHLGCLHLGWVYPQQQLVPAHSDNASHQLYCFPPHPNLQAVAMRAGSTVAPVYQLVAVSHHSGSLEGGHYTATARSAADSQWYNFNDSHVRRDAKPSGASSSAYVLVYRLESL
jgi:hypothetical protein